MNMSKKQLPFMLIIVGVNGKSVRLGTMCPVTKEVVRFYIEQYPRSYIEI